MPKINSQQFTSVILEDDDCVVVSVDVGAVYITVNGITLLRIKTPKGVDADIMLNGARV
jgi:hypothetical protein